MRGSGVSGKRASLATEFMQESTRMARDSGPVFRRSFFNLDFTFVCGVELVAELADERRFVKHVYPNLAALTPMMGDGLLTAETDDPRWQVAHQVLAAGFSQQAMRRYHPAMTSVTDELIRAWDVAAGVRSVDVLEDMTRTSLSIIAQAGFGQSLNTFGHAGAHPIVDSLNQVMMYGIRRVTLPRDLVLLLGRRSEQQAAEHLGRLDAMVDAMIDSRGGTDPGTDLLGLMLDAGSLDRRSVRHQIITFLAAGFETTAGTLSFVLHALANHQDVLARARAEVDEVWGDRTPGYEQVLRLRYLRRVIDETLRLWPTAPGYARRARADTLLGGRYPMRAGEAMFVLIPALHRQPVWGPGIERFDPDRFERDRVTDRPPHAFKPFGSGLRACIGRQFAVHQVALVIGALIRRYDLRPDPAYRLRIDETLTMRPAGFTLELTPRKESRG